MKEIGQALSDALRTFLVVQEEEKQRRSVVKFHQEHLFSAQTELRKMELRRHRLEAELEPLLRSLFT